METFVYLCSSLAALGHLKASFHGARLHYLCPLNNSNQKQENGL